MFLSLVKMIQWFHTNKIKMLWSLLKGLEQWSLLWQIMFLNFLFKNIQLFQLTWLENVLLSC